MGTPPPFGVYEADRDSGPRGIVYRSDNPITDDVAIRWLQNGADVVACGPDSALNRAKARELTVAAFGGCTPDAPHGKGGRDRALAHFHPPGRTPEVHAFFEEWPRRHASRRRA